MRDHSRPEPVVLEVGGKTMATAYARRPPGNRAGTEHWAWVVHYIDAASGTAVQRSMGRIAPEMVGMVLAEFYQGINKC